MNWTHEKPTAPGFYWYKPSPEDSYWNRACDLSRREVCELMKGEDSVSFAGDEQPYALADARGEFAGPIPIPT